MFLAYRASSVTSCAIVNLSCQMKHYKQALPVCSTKLSFSHALYATIYLTDPVGGSIADWLDAGIDIQRLHDQVPV